MPLFSLTGYSFFPSSFIVLNLLFIFLFVCSFTSSYFWIFSSCLHLPFFSLNVYSFRSFSSIFLFILLSLSLTYFSSSCLSVLSFLPIFGSFHHFFICPFLCKCFSFLSFSPIFLFILLSLCLTYFSSSCLSDLSFLLIF